jgi:hypothetical protein
MHISFNKSNCHFRLVVLCLWGEIPGAEAGRPTDNAHCQLVLVPAVAVLGTSWLLYKRVKGWHEYLGFAVAERWDCSFLQLHTRLSETPGAYFTACSQGPYCLPYQSIRRDSRLKSLHKSTTPPVLQHLYPAAAVSDACLHAMLSVHLPCSQTNILT